MPKEFSFDDSKNMVYAVSGSYVSKNEVYSYFNQNYNKDKMFQAYELKQIVRILTTGKERITAEMGDNVMIQKKILHKKEDKER